MYKASQNNSRYLQDKNAKMFMHEAHFLLWKHLFASILFADDVILLATSVTSSVHSRVFTAWCDRVSPQIQMFLYNVYCPTEVRNIKAAAKIC